MTIGNAVGRQLHVDLEALGAEREAVVDRRHGVLRRAQGAAAMREHQPPIGGKDWRAARRHERQISTNSAARPWAETISPFVNSRLAGKMSLGALGSWRNSAGTAWASNRRDSEPPRHFPVSTLPRLARTFTPGDIVSSRRPRCATRRFSSRADKSMRATIDRIKPDGSLPLAMVRLHGGPSLRSFLAFTN